MTLFTISDLSRLPIAETEDENQYILLFDPDNEPHLQRGKLDDLILDHMQFGAATRYARISGDTGSAKFEAQGSDSDIPIILQFKGSSILQVKSGGTALCRFNTTAFQPEAALYELGATTNPWGDFHCDGFVTLGPSSELTIASGAIVPTGSYHTVDTESEAASDDLDTITATNATDGAILVLRAISSSRTVTVKDGTGNILLAGDMVLDNSADTLTLKYAGSNWVEIARADVGA